MELRDRKMLQRLMIVQEVSNRRLAKAAGWKSHSYMNRLVSGQVKTLEPEPALRIAKFLGVGVEDLFLTQVSDFNELLDTEKKIRNFNVNSTRGTENECSAPGACHPSVLGRIIKENKNGFSTKTTETAAPSELSPVKEVGFGVRPSFFRSQAHRLPVGPKKVAERDEVKVREKAFSDAVQTIRSAADALHRFKALDQTGQLVAGIEHLDVHLNRARHAADTLQDMAEAFAKVWKL